MWIANGPPAGATFGGVTPYLLTSGSQFRPPPPPAFGSPAFLTDLDEIKTLSVTRTPAQQAIASYWNFPTGTFTPPGYWNLADRELHRSVWLGRARGDACVCVDACGDGGRADRLLGREVLLLDAAAVAGRPVDHLDLRACRIIRRIRRDTRASRRRRRRCWRTCSPIGRRKSVDG